MSIRQLGRLIVRLSALLRRNKCVPKVPLYHKTERDKSSFPCIRGILSVFPLANMNLWRLIRLWLIEGDLIVAKSRLHKINSDISVRVRFFTFL